MKKTLTINLNGTVFNIDEDAYELLDDYLRNLRIYFRKDESSNEILADFEARIAELFNERLRLGYTVISIDQVRDIIEKIGNPEDFDDVDDSRDEETSGSKSAKSASGEKKKAKKRLHRDVDDKMFGGVCSGIAAYFGWDVTPIRIIFVILTFVSSFWLIPVYLLLWIFVPAARTAEQKLEMRGEEVTVENIGKTVAEPPVNKQRSAGDSFLDFLVSVLKIGLVGLGIIIGLPLIFALVIAIIVLVALLFGGLSIPIVGLDWINGGLFTLTHPVFSVLSIVILLGVPLFSLIYSIVAYFGKFKPIPKSVKITSLIVWIVALVYICSYGVEFNPGKFAKNGNWVINWGNGNHHGENVEHGNGEMIDLNLTIPAFDELKLDNNLFANVILVQAKGDSSSMLINTDSNIADKITWEVEDSVLRLSTKDNLVLNPVNSIIIKITTPGLKSVKMRSVGSVTVENQMIVDSLYVKMEGAGNFIADSLVLNNLIANVKGVGSMTVGGKVTKAEYKLEGAGKIGAIGLEADTVIAKLEGVGSIRSNPVNHIKASVDGVGKITYKNEPKSKDVSFKGVGKIGKD